MATKQPIANVDFSVSVNETHFGSETHFGRAISHNNMKDPCPPPSHTREKLPRRNTENMTFE